MNELLNKKELKRLGFKEIRTAEGSKGKGIVYSYDIFQVTLFAKHPEDPAISMIIYDTAVPFPGAYTVKDLLDLMIMYYGDDSYDKRFPNRKAMIIETWYPEDVMKERVTGAFDEGFQSADKNVSGEDYHITSEEWYNKKYGNK